ncbi:hypothetical protein A2U01_0062073, partial [Trifolium medium]|nr:hypothetical protein [Trifolium medium]
VLARRAVQLTSSMSLLWKMRVAQADMVTCALRMAYGATRQHQFLEEIKAFLDGTGVYKRSTGLTN